MDKLLALLALSLLLGLPLAYAWLQTRLLRRWTGRWRFAVGLPLTGWAIWIINFARDVGRDASSHSLFPLEILMWSGVATAYFGILAVVRHIAIRQA